jgi:hypothetical protein
LFGIVSPAACNITFENDSHKSSKLFPELISSSVEPLGNGTGFKDKRKNQIFQFIGQTSENSGTKLLT